MSPFVILQREKARLPHPILLYEQVLTELALATRRKGTTLLSQEEAVQVVHRSLRHFNSSCPVFEIVHDLTAANLLTGDIRRGVGFSHELILEFYAAKGLNALILAGTEQLADIAMRVDWHEVVRMYVGLQESPANALNCLVAANVVLAVRCITAGAESSKHIEARIVQLCRLMVADKANPELASQGITALLELGTKHALRVIIHMPIERNKVLREMKCAKLS
jgi:hypothetical protein